MHGKVDRIVSASVLVAEDEAREMYDYLACWAERDSHALPEKMPQVFHDLYRSLADIVDEI